jgi:hypothetical protein
MFCGFYRAFEFTLAKSACYRGVVYANRRTHQTASIDSIFENLLLNQFNIKLSAVSIQLSAGKGGAMG